MATGLFASTQKTKHCRGTKEIRPSKKQSLGWSQKTTTEYGKKTGFRGNIPKRGAGKAQRGGSLSSKNAGVGGFEGRP